MENIESNTTCSAWGEGWTESMPEHIAEEAVENGTVSESCL